jgi:Na+-driven multidrug efflux pump
MNKDLTVGKPSQVLWQFCLPMFGSIIFQQLYNIADSLVAGKFIGENALAAVGNSYEITLIFIALAATLAARSSCPATLAQRTTMR